MEKHIFGQERAEYIKSNDWKCSISPTGAHHWIINRQTICKYCSKVEQPHAVKSSTIIAG
jgi:hypothetical protein